MFWNYTKLNRTDSIGVPPLKVENNVIDSNKDKANLLNKNFQSVFTNEDTTNIPNKGRRPSLKSETSCLKQVELSNNYET